ncbi:hypothetical protein X546_23500 [Brevibacillus borstelensis cifa_chp40]|nr:hypothetical protein X546_23500 [Brevibacillus borstelensis cifa_chp40]
MVGEEAGEPAGEWVLEGEIVGGGFRIIQSCGGLERLGGVWGRGVFCGSRGRRGAYRLLGLDGGWCGVVWVSTLRPKIVAILSPCDTM